METSIGSEVQNFSTGGKVKKRGSRAIENEECSSFKTTTNRENPERIGIKGPRGALV